MKKDKECKLKSLPESTTVYVCDCGCNNIYLSEDVAFYDLHDGEVVLL